MSTTSTPQFGQFAHGNVPEAFLLAQSAHIACYLLEQGNSEKKLIRENEIGRARKDCPRSSSIKRRCILSRCFLTQADTFGTFESLSTQILREKRDLLRGLELDCHCWMGLVNGEIFVNSTIQSVHIVRVIGMEGPEGFLTIALAVWLR